LAEEEPTHKWTVPELQTVLMRFSMEPIAAIPTMFPCLYAYLGAAWIEEFDAQGGGFVESTKEKLRSALGGSLDAWGKKPLQNIVIRMALKEAMDGITQEYLESYERNPWLGDFAPSSAVFGPSETFFDLVFRKVCVIARFAGVKEFGVQSNVWKALLAQVPKSHKDPVLVRTAKLAKLDELLKMGNAASSLSSSVMKEAALMKRVVDGRSFFLEPIKSLELPE